jgi:hypothetical protein
MKTLLQEELALWCHSALRDEKMAQLSGFAHEQNICEHVGQI